jgi:hypothetical protein
MGGALWRVDVSSTRRCPCERGCGPEAGIVPTELSSARRRSWMVRPSLAFSQSSADVAAGKRILYAAQDPEDDAPREASRFAAGDAPTNAFGCRASACDVGDCARCRALWAPAEYALRWPCRRTEGVPCGTDVMRPTYAWVIPASTSFVQSTEWRPSRNCLIRAARRRRQCPKARPSAGSKRSGEH